MILPLLTLPLIFYTQNGLCATTNSISIRSNVLSVTASSKTSKSSKTSTKMNSQPKLGPKIPGTSDFAVIRHSSTFIDKTDFIHEWLTHQPKHWYVMAPPGFGKSSLLSMVQHFCGGSVKLVEHTIQIHAEKNSDELFRGTKISSVRDFFNRHFQNYIILSINFSPLRNATDYGSFRRLFCTVIDNVVRRYHFLADYKNLNKYERNFLGAYEKISIALCTASISEITVPLLTLMKILKQHTRKEVIVLVDDIDAALTAIMMNNFEIDVDDIFSDMALFVRELTSIGAWSPAKCLFTGSLDLRLGIPGNTSIQSSDFFHDERTAVFFGLTGEEVDSLLLQHSLPDDKCALTDMLNGYKIMGSSITLYNTRAVLACIQDHRVSTPDEVTSAILRAFEKLFSDEWVGQDIVQILFGGGIIIKEDSDTTYTHLIELKKKVTYGTALATNFNLDRRQHYTFIWVLLRLGLIKVVGYNPYQKLTLAPANRFNTGILRDYFYNNSYTERSFKVKARDEVSLTNAIKNLAPSNASIQAFGEAISNIVKGSVPGDEAHFKSLIYVFARKTADHYSEDILLQAGVPVHDKDGKNPERKQSSIGMIDLLMVQERKSMVVIVVVKFKSDAARELRLMHSRRYVEIFDGKSYSKYNLMDKILICISVSHSGSITIKGEVRGETGTIRLSYFRL